MRVRFIFLLIAILLSGSHLIAEEKKSVALDPLSSMGDMDEIKKM